LSKSVASIVIYLSEDTDGAAMSSDPVDTIEENDVNEAACDVVLTTSVPAPYMPSQMWNKVPILLM